MNFGYQEGVSNPTYGSGESNQAPTYGNSNQAPQQSASSSGSTPGPYFQSYQNAYSNALNLNNQNYQNILSGYRTQMGAISAKESEIAQGYTGLGQQVQSAIRGVGKSQAQAIKDTFAQQWGGAQQQMINAGLGNTTVRQSVNRGYTLDEQKAAVALSNQMAQLQAGYMSSIGTARLGSMEQAMGMGTGLTGQYLGVLGGYKTPYPGFPSPGQQSQSMGGGGGGRSQQGGGGGQSTQQSGGGGGTTYGYTFGGGNLGGATVGPGMSGGGSAGYGGNYGYSATDLYQQPVNYLGDEYGAAMGGGGGYGDPYSGADFGGGGGE